MNLVYNSVVNEIDSRRHTSALRDYKYTDIIECDYGNVDNVGSNLRWYDKRRTDIEKYFIESNRISIQMCPDSPSKNYMLDVELYRTKTGCWNYTCGVIRDRQREVILEVKRNYPSFWYSWVTCANKEYLLCGEDYQGVTILDPKTKIKKTVLTPESENGRAFCIREAFPSPKGDKVVFSGCYWGEPSCLRVYKFEYFNLKKMDVSLYQCSMLKHNFSEWIDNSNIKIDIIKEEIDEQTGNLYELKTFLDIKVD